MNINVQLFSLYSGTSSCGAGTRPASPAACNLPGLRFRLESKKVPHTKPWGKQRSWYGPTALLSTRVYWIFNPLIHNAAKTLYQFNLPQDARPLLGMQEVNRAVCSFKDTHPSPAAPGQPEGQAETTALT